MDTISGLSALVLPSFCFFKNFLEIKQTTLAPKYFRTKIYLLFAFRDSFLKFPFKNWNEILCFTIVFQIPHVFKFQRPFETSVQQTVVVCVKNPPKKSDTVNGAWILKNRFCMLSGIARIAIKNLPLLLHKYSL